MRVGKRILFSILLSISNFYSYPAAYGNGTPLLSLQDFLFMERATKELRTLEYWERKHEQYNSAAYKEYVTKYRQDIARQSTSDVIRQRLLEDVTKQMYTKPQPLFSEKHDFGELVKFCGGTKESTVRAMLEAASGNIPADGIFQYIPIKIDKFNLYICGRVMDEIPLISTCFERVV